DRLAGKRRLEVRDVALHLGLPDVLQRPNARQVAPGLRRANQAPVVAAGKAAVLGEVAGELLLVAPGDAGPRLVRLVLALLEPLDPLARVVREVRLPLLAVVDAVHAARELQLDDLRDGAPGARRE